jgi:large subunit ribosomal protein L18
MFKKDYKKRNRKKAKVRKKISGTTDVPRISVFRSLTQIYAQVVDDSTGKTIVSASSKSKEIEAEVKKAKNKIEVSKIVGNLLAKKAEEKGVKKAVFDKSSYTYHGRIKALADGVRDGGIKF